MTDSLLTERHDAVTVLTINRPEVRNALNQDVMVALRAALTAAETDGTRCVVLTGAGGAFSSGADIKQALADGLDADGLTHLLSAVYGPTLKAIRATSWPVIAAVDGLAGGLGCDMALACDLRLISERARFAELFIRVGLIPDGGGTYLLPRLIGTGRAFELLFTGRDVAAAEAQQIGLANHVYPVETFMTAVLQFATTISQQSPQALRRGKAALLAALDSSYAEALDHEHAHQHAILTSADGLEGFRAFAEKRPPVWTSR
ncbi:MAG: 2-(1,2-epoxy-1,2-dihydrophenyl)acetyl-CoA isomerase [Chloroflexi bacterium]|nr:2-(1,2-epoxy-1,2-dihydrophenyl)acetyl-CoA isomerase [Chloroflexota bacterium]